MGGAQGSGSAYARISGSVAIDSMLAMVPVRSDEAYEAELARAFRAESEGADQKSRAERARSVVRAQREVQEAEIDRIKKEMDIAKDLDQPEQRSVLEAEKKLRERYRDYLGDRAEALKREADLGDQRVRYSRSLRNRIDAERKVAADFSARRARLVAAAEDAAAPAANRVTDEESVLKNLKKYFEAVRDEARQGERLSQREREHAEKLIDVVNKRMKLLDG